MERPVNMVYPYYSTFVIKINALNVWMRVIFFPWTYISLAHGTLNQWVTQDKIGGLHFIHFMFCCVFLPAALKPVVGTKGHLSISLLHQENMIYSAAYTGLLLFCVRFLYWWQWYDCLHCVAIVTCI